MRGREGGREREGGETETETETERKSERERERGKVIDNQQVLKRERERECVCVSERVYCRQDLRDYSAFFSHLAFKATPAGNFSGVFQHIGKTSPQSCVERDAQRTGASLLQPARWCPRVLANRDVHDPPLRRAMSESSSERAPARSAERGKVQEESFSTWAWLHLALSRHHHHQQQPWQPWR